MKTGHWWIALVICGAVFGSPSGTISGVVKDRSGGAVTGARVTLVCASNGARRATLSDAAGGFQFAPLDPAVWSLEAEAPGFKRTSIPDVLVQVDQVTRASVVLEVGELTETIEVAGVAPMARGVIDRRAMALLPLNGRQFLDLALLTPGVVPTAAGTQGNGFSAAGARSQSNVYLLDGISNQDTQTNDALNGFRITDAVEEFAVQTSVATAEFGRGAGAQVNVVTRSGSNQLHGSAFEYLRNTAFDATDFFTNKLGGTKNPLHRNQFGGTAGGPVVRGRTFFFASYEGFRQVAPQVSATRVPTDAERASVTDPVAKRLLAWWPLANAAGTQNFIANVQNQDSDNTGLLRIDHALGTRDQLSARWIQYEGWSVVPGTTPLSGGNQGPPQQLSFGLNETHTFSPRFLSELRLGFSRNRQERTLQDEGFNAATVFGDAASVPVNAGLPSITVAGGYAQLGSNQNFPQGRRSSTMEVFENVSRHSSKWGFHMRREDLRRYLERATRGALSFASFADFARGQVNSSTFRTGSTLTYWRRYPWDVYWQDEYKLRPNLALSFGVRYEYPSAAGETRNHATNFVPGLGPVVVGTNQALDIDPSLKGPSALVFRTAPLTLPASGVHADRNNFAPMVGFAYSPGGDTVVRGGARVAYDDLFNNVPAGMALAAPYNLQTTQTANGTQLGKFPWAVAFDQNVPLVSNFGRQAPGTPTVGVLTFQGLDPNLRSAYLYQYNLGVQRRAGAGWWVEANYQGSAGRRLGMFVDVNQPLVIVRDASRRGPVAPNEQVFPYNHFGQAQVAKSIGNSNYNGLVFTARRQGRRVYAQASYTLGKSLDYNSSYFGSGNLPGETGAPADSTNLRLEHGPSAFDVRQRFDMLYAVEGPWGLRLSGATTVQTGRPFTVVTGGQDISGFNQVNPGTSPSGGNRPDVVKAGPVAQNNANPDAALDPSWFATAPAGRVGTSGRNQYYGPGLVNWDVSVTKEFRIGDRAALQLRGDFFNLFNHTNFANPVSDTSNVSFGKITQTLGSAVSNSAGTTSGPMGGPRLVQIAVRVRF
jgi:hypothetical protein